jgi:hypothetical protein
MTRKCFVLTILIAVSLPVVSGADPAPNGAHIDREPVQSTSLASVGYDGAGKILEIEFISGAVYRYTAVPEKVYRELLAAESKGRYFSKNIRGQYEFVKVPAGAK